MPEAPYPWPPITDEDYALYIMDVFEPSTIEIAYSRYIVRPSLDPHSLPERSIPDTFANYVALKFSHNSIKCAYKLCAQSNE